MDIQNVYKDLTGIDIEEQERLWNERGKGYWGEYLVFREMFNKVPGYGKILMNLNIPSYYDKTTEIDLIYLHETGVYVFEVKHYKGIIYGKIDDTNWTQYFRTAPNHTFYSPIKQNEGHIKALECILPNASFSSFVVFTNDTCELRITGIREGVFIGKLNEVIDQFLKTIEKKPTLYSLETLDAFFNQLLIYSPATSSEISYDSTIIPFYEYAVILKKDKDTQIEKMAQEKKTQIDLIASEYNRKAKRGRIKASLFAMLAVIIVGIVSVVVCSNYNQQAKGSELKMEEALAETAEMQKRFEYVVPFDGKDYQLSDDFINVSDVIVEEATEFESAVKFHSVLSVNSGEYGIKLLPNTSYIILLKDGTSKEYPFFDDSIRYSDSYRIIQGITWYNDLILERLFADVSLDEIKYIKLHSVGFWQNNLYTMNDMIRDDIEIEFYSAR